MSIKLVGILGIGGAVGRITFDILRHSYNIRGGQRNKPKDLKNYKNFQWKQVDLYKDQELYEFCLGCDVILNCTGPSLCIKERVALMAAKAKASYVDIFGTDLLENVLLEKGLDKEGVFVISAGSFPGFSGILPLWMAEEYFDIVDTLTVYSGSNERICYGAAADYLLSSALGFGVPNAFIRNNSVIVDSCNTLSEMYFSFLKKNVYIQKFLSNETIKLVKILGLKEACLYNIVADKEISSVASESYGILLKNNNRESLNKAVNKLINATDIALKKSSPWNILIVEMKGKFQGQTVAKRGMVFNKSSYEISGIIAALSVESILESKTENGIYWALDFLNPTKTMKKITSMDKDIKVEISDFSCYEIASLFVDTEEGFI